MEPVVPLEERNFRRCLSALWTRPGFKLTLTSRVGFGAIVVRRHGVPSLAVALPIALASGLPLGYRSFRRKGRV